MTIVQILFGYKNYGTIIEAKEAVSHKPTIRLLQPA